MPTDHHRAGRRSPWLDTAEAAEYLGYSRSTICALVRSGQLVASQRRPGAEYRFRTEWLDAFVESGRIGKKSLTKPILRLQSPSTDDVWATMKAKAKARQQARQQAGGGSR